ncbi:DUF899 family protein [Pseudonocardia sp. NPDC049635]|uniref:DUF899 family protein n=1 Tax=Pseudonocardia sp. NPDC049635 TaxID=3155506 RepID=UPI0033E29829
MVREKAHTRAGDALAAQCRRPPMVEFDGPVEVVGPDGPVPFRDLFQGRDELVVHKHTWNDGAPHQDQCEGCTTTAWHLRDTVCPSARGVSVAVVTTGEWDEVAAGYVGFMGYPRHLYSVRGPDEPVGGDMGFLTSYLRDGDRTFLTYSTTGRRNEPVSGSFALLDRTPRGRGEAWEDGPGDRDACWYWRTDAAGSPASGPTSRPVPQWTRAGATAVATLGRHSHWHSPALPLTGPRVRPLTGNGGPPAAMG